MYVRIRHSYKVELRKSMETDEVKRITRDRLWITIAATGWEKT